MMIDSRRILGGFGVFALVLMRLVIGWHFFGEGSKKVEYDRHDGSWRMVFSADKELLNLAKGPLAPLYFEHTPSEHGWRDKLATPRENTPATAAQLEEQSTWARDYAKARAEAKAKGETAAIQFPPRSASHDYATQIATDWRAAVDKFKSIAGLTEEQKKQADEVLHKQLSDLQDFFIEEEENISEYRHDLWRLANWRNSGEAGEVPFVDQRITAKAGETTAKVTGWRADVRGFEEQLGNNLANILTDEQRKQVPVQNSLDEALADRNQHKLDFINYAATAVTIGVGICLIFGLMTRLAAIVGAIFLLGVIASQPFWVSGTIPTINQCVEFSALLVLAATGAGRWAGIDGCLGALFGRRRTLIVDEAV
jgi:uncharacterized membrane protein YphA (DoxX/SURF4 family)